jgi:hypothetical protein
MHDCLPPDSYVARRDWTDKTLAHLTMYKTDWWAGDVWKTAYMLQRLRPDLEIFGLNSPPTGLIAITNLDPGSQTLSRRYCELLQEYRPIQLHACINNYMRALKMMDAEQYIQSELVAKLSASCTGPTSCSGA